MSEVPLYTPNRSHMFWLSIRIPCIAPKIQSPILKPQIFTQVSHVADHGVGARALDPPLATEGKQLDQRPKASFFIPVA